MLPYPMAQARRALIRRALAASAAPVPVPKAARRRPPRPPSPPPDDVGPFDLSHLIERGDDTPADPNPFDHLR